MNSFGGTHPPPATARRKIRRRRRRGGAPSTPFQYWTFFNNNNESKKHLRFSSDAEAGDEAKFSGGGHAVEPSARNLAAGLWRLRLLRYGIGGFNARRKPSDRSRFKHGTPRVNTMLSRDHSSKEHRSGTRHQLRRSQSTIVGPKQGTLHKHSKSKEGAIKRDRPDGRCSKASPIEVYGFASHMKLLEEQVKTVSFVSALQAELVQARLYIHNLEYEVQSSRNRVKYLERKLGVEGTSRQKTEHEKIYALVDDLKGQLSRERKKQQKTDEINSRLIKELAEAKLPAIQSVRKYKAEKRTRKLLEQVCHELARKIGEDEAEVEAMRIETMKIREEVEEERSMLQVAEVWREERVQMKLIDAKLALESKYSQLNKLITDLETFLMSRSTSLNMRDLRKAELIGQAVKAASIQDTEEFSYEPPGSGDIFSIFEELQQVGVFGREIEPWFNYALTGDISDFHPVSPQENDHDNDHVLDYSNGMEDNATGHEEVYRVENQGSVEESGLTIITVGARGSAPRFEIEQDEADTRVSPNTETNQVCSISVGQPKRKKSSSAKLRTSCASSSEAYKAITDEGNGRVSSGIVSIPGTYLKHGKPMALGMIRGIERPRSGSRERKQDISIA
ncbi:hypothetical protein like AT1G50660 [Hibiscus trionum]|uniref:Uncharacterized protein n=1 Tax=Hibiscus trionum TaxID=183268 RepID=A0A9W7IFD3_HIBTR|nr:hypothetical protein like AT1G50660 [Hibiscus trionum]